MRRTAPQAQTLLRSRSALNMHTNVVKRTENPPLPIVGEFLVGEFSDALFCQHRSFGSTVPSSDQGAHVVVKLHNKAHRTKNSRNTPLTLTQKMLIKKIKYIREHWEASGLSTLETADAINASADFINTLLYCPFNSLRPAQAAPINHLRIMVASRLNAPCLSPTETESRKVAIGNSVAAQVADMLERANLVLGAPSVSERAAMAINRIEGVEQDDTNRAITLLVKKGHLSAREGLLLAAKHAAKS